MFLSVVILGRFTTETHAMALYIGTDTPHTHLHHVTGRNLIFTWTQLPPWYQSPFYNRMGFELALGYHATVTRSDLRDELFRLIDDHDGQETETLVVTLNAPVRSGLTFPSSGLIAKMLFEDEQPLEGWTPAHIERVALC